MAVIRVCDICDERIYTNTKFYKLDYGSETDAFHDNRDDSLSDRTIHMEICGKCFKAIIEARKNKENPNDN